MAKTVLITGISGFIAKHTALAFLNAGHAVRGTVRSIAKGEAVRTTLAKHCDTSKLTLVEADLLSDGGWDDAVEGVDGIAHLASPFPLAQPKDENELIRPAVEGTMRVLKLAVKHKVPRFVQTSSLVAVLEGYGDSHPQPFTEDDWSALDGPGITPYAKSKTLAERAARDFIAAEKPALHYSTVNPGIVFGPALDEDVGSSAEVIGMLLKGAYPAIPRLYFYPVDVRDIAKMHVLAMETDQPSGGRYIGATDQLWYVEVSRALKEHFGQAARKAPSREMPDFLVKTVALFDKTARSIIHDLGRKKIVDNSRTRNALSIEFIPARDAAIATAKSLIDMKLV